MDDTGQKAELQQHHLGLKLTMEMRSDSRTGRRQANNQHDKLDGCSMDGIYLQHQMQLDGHEM